MAADDALETAEAAERCEPAAECELPLREIPAAACRHSQERDEEHQQLDGGEPDGV